MVTKDWTQDAANDIINLAAHGIGLEDRATLQKIIQKHCPFKQGVAYEEVSNSAKPFVKKLLEKGSWYLSAIELDSDIDGEELHEEAVRIVNS